MRIGVVVDASCDLPQALLDEHRIGVLPIGLRLGEEQLTDVHDLSATLQFYREHLASKGMDAETIPLTADQIRSKFLQQWVLDYDYVFCITITSTRSPIFENASKASFSILSDYKTVRSAAGISGPFALRVVDSQTMFCGSAVLALEAAKMIKTAAQPNAIRKRLDDLREDIVGYMVPNDLYYIRNRGIKKGDKSVGLVSYALGSALNIRPVILCYRGETQPIAKIRSFDRAVAQLFSHVAKQIERGIQTQHVCISYGGDPAEIENLPGFAEFLASARAHQIEVVTSIMSATAGVNTGAGCLGIAYGGELRPFGE